jgi:hypothetical protein
MPAELNFAITEFSEVELPLSVLCPKFAKKDGFKHHSFE